MAEGPVSDTLAARRDLVVLLRLVVEVGGRVIYGEVVDTRRPLRRFVGEQGLVAVLRGLLGSEKRASTIPAPGARGESGRVPNKRHRLPARTAWATPAVAGERSTARPTDVSEIS